jgi:hypothetical protein
MDFVPNPNNPNQANVPFNALSMYQLPPGSFGVGVGPPLPYGGDGAGAGGLAGNMGTGAGLGLTLATGGPGGNANALFAHNAHNAAGAADALGSLGPSLTRVNAAVGGSLGVSLPNVSVPREKSRCQHPGCSKAFAWPQDLSKHVRRHHAGEPPRFECPHADCGKRFFERKLLVAHERTHTDERPFVCPHPGCDKAFRARNALAYHVKALHESGETFACAEPGCAFVTRRPEALAAHKTGHERRDVAKEWRARAKHEVAAAVRSAKSALSEMATELASAEKELARERREHAREKKLLEKLRARRDALRRRVAAGAETRKEAKGGKKNGNTSGDGGDANEVDAGASPERGAEETREGGAVRRMRKRKRSAECDGLGESSDDSAFDAADESDSDAELCGVVLPEDDDMPIVSAR